MRKKSADANLDPFRQGVAVLRRDREVAGHVATVVEWMWAPFSRSERVWLLVTWVDGGREIFEDYEPWAFATELLSGRFVWGERSTQVEFTAEWLTGSERVAAWQEYGILKEVGEYM